MKILAYFKYFMIGVFIFFMLAIYAKRDFSINNLQGYSYDRL